MGKLVKELEPVFRALANKRRITMVQNIRKNKEICVSDIAEEIHLSFRSTSRHLAVLQKAGILEKEQRGVQMFYRISSHLSDTDRKILALL